MKKIIYFLLPVLVMAFFSQCKKSKPGKLENPFGLMSLGSDTSLTDGRYVIRTKNGCGGWAGTLRCDYIDGAIGVNGHLTAVDHISLLDIDSAEVWYVKKVRYVSPDPDYALAFGYRIYQRLSNGQYRFLAFTATGNTGQWPYDEIGFTFGDGDSKSVKAGTIERDNYPPDPPIPGFATSNDTSLQISTRYLFQLYVPENSPGSFNIKAGGLRSTTGSQPYDRWHFCMAYLNNGDCEISNIYPHFRGESPKCEGWHENGNDSRRCYIGEYYFQKVY